MKFSYVTLPDYPLADSLEMIKTAVDKLSWEEDPSNTIIDKNGTLVVRQTPENQRAIRELLTNLRRTTGLQVAIESRFISVENNFLQDIGVDWRGLGDNTGGTGVPGKGTAAPFDDFGPLATWSLSVSPAHRQMDAEFVQEPEPGGGQPQLLFAKGGALLGRGFPGAAALFFRVQSSRCKARQTVLMQTWTRPRRRRSWRNSSSVASGNSAVRSASLTRLLSSSLAGAPPPCGPCPPPPRSQ